jgi:hypothetical protein
MESGIDASVVSLNFINKNEVKTCNDEEIVKEDLLKTQEKAEKKRIIPNRLKGSILVIVGAFLFCMNSTFSKMAFTLSVGDNTFVSSILIYN